MTHQKLLKSWNVLETVFSPLNYINWLNHKYQGNV